MEGNFGFVFRLNEKNFRCYVEQVRSFKPGVYVVVGEDAGILGVDRSEGGTFLRHIELSPDYQRAGLGVALISSLVEEAKATNLPLRLRVSKMNRAKTLCERLGLCVTGETGLKKYSMSL